jgi:hypothetical protein
MVNPNKNIEIKAKDLMRPNRESFHINTVTEKTLNSLKLGFLRPRAVSNYAHLYVVTTALKDDALSNNKPIVKRNIGRGRPRLGSYQYHKAEDNCGFDIVSSKMKNTSLNSS